MRGASREEIREPYVRLAKSYHPDRYATVALPPEVSNYLAAMARRIDAAHAALEVPQTRSAAQEARPFAGTAATARVAPAGGCRHGLAVCSSFCMSSASS